MACSQNLTGIAAACETNVGGIREVFIANYDDVEAVEVDASTHMIDTITMASGKYFYQYNFKKNTSSMNSTLNVDPTAGVNFVQTDVALVFAKQETAKRMEVAKLALGELAVIVKDANAKYWFLGQEEFVSATAGTAETGTNRTDGNRYTITLTDYSSSYPYEVDPTIISTLVSQ